MVQPFFTTKENGLGVGLSICRTIVEAHGGRIAAENTAHGGLTVRFGVPARPAVKPADSGHEPATVLTS